jgi:hypothetical protein
MKKPIKKCKHKILVSSEYEQSTAKCTKCPKVFGRDNEDEFFSLIENEYYTGQMVYTRNKRTTDEDIQEIIKEYKDDN